MSLLQHCVSANEVVGGECWKGGAENGGARQQKQAVGYDDTGLTACFARGFALRDAAGASKCVRECVRTGVRDGFFRCPRSEPPTTPSSYTPPKSRRGQNRPRSTPILVFKVATRRRMMPNCDAGVSAAEWRWVARPGRLAYFFFFKSPTPQVPHFLRFGWRLLQCADLRVTATDQPDWSASSCLDEALERRSWQQLGRGAHSVAYGDGDREVSWCCALTRRRWW